MAKDTDADRAWKLMDKVSICMLTTRDGQRLRSRPMAASPRPAENAVYFLTDARRHKDEEIEAHPEVCLCFADTGGQKYVSVSGEAEVLNDRAKISELWSTAAQAWWDGPEDPNIRVLRVAPEEAEFWDGPGTVVSYMKMTAAAVSGSRPDLGENRKVSM